MNFLSYVELEIKTANQLNVFCSRLKSGTERVINSSLAYSSIDLLTIKKI